MRVKIRVFILCIIALMLLGSVVGCGAAPTGNPGETPDNSMAPSSSPSEPAGEASPSPSQEPWHPVIEENLNEDALNAWLDTYITAVNYGTPQQMHDAVRDALPTVPSEVADAMAWIYIKTLRDYRDTLTEYYLTSEEQEALLNAYQGGDTFDMSALTDDQKVTLDMMEGLEFGWSSVEGMMEIRIRYDRLQEWMTACSPVFQQYLSLLADDGEQPPAVDGALQIRYPELADRVLSIEAVLPYVTGAPFQGDVEDLYVRYLDLLLSGADTPSVFDMQRYYDTDTLALNADAESAFQHVLEAAPQSATAAAVSDWWGQLKDLVNSGASGEDAYQQVWDSFSAKIAEYSAAAGVRVPRIGMAVTHETADTDMLVSDMEYPIFYGEGIPEDVLTGLSDWISGDLADFRTGIEVQTTEDHSLNAEREIPLPPYGAYSRLRLARSAGPVVSVVADMESYLGGAHGSDYRSGYNFDPATGIKVELADLFKPGADAWALLEAEVSRQITLLQDRAAETGVYQDYVPYEEYSGLDPAQTQWYATDEGIVVIFQQYEIGPYALGIPEFTVPWSRLADSLAQ